MKHLLYSLIFITQSAWAHQKPVLKVGPATPAQFKFLQSENGDKVTIQKVGAKTAQIVKYTTTTISQTLRMHIELENSRNQKKSIDMLAVVSSVAARTQTVEVFIPSRDEDFIISKNMSPVCALENFGDFYIENPEVDVPKFFQVEENSGRVALNVLVQKNEQSQAKMTNCFQAMLNAKK